MGIMTEITTTTIVISMKRQSEGNNYRSARPRRSTCIFKQMPVSELAVMSFQVRCGILAPKSVIRDEIQAFP